MAKDERKRQKKLAKQRSKANTKARTLKEQKQKLKSRSGMVGTAAVGAIVYCGIGELDTEINGMKSVVIVRRLTSRECVAVFFLVDLWCLGVKDVSYIVDSEHEIRERMKKMSDALIYKRADPPVARSLVEHSVEFARLLGLGPHVDYRWTKAIWGDIELATDVEFEFGSDGKPLYMPGPFEDEARREYVFKTLEENVGLGNFDFIMPADDLAHLGIDEPDIQYLD